MRKSAIKELRDLLSELDTLVHSVEEVSEQALGLIDEAEIELDAAEDARDSAESDLQDCRDEVKQLEAQ